MTAPATRDPLPPTFARHQHWTRRHPDSLHHCFWSSQQSPRLTVAHNGLCARLQARETLGFRDVSPLKQGVWVWVRGSATSGIS
ncbi:hypothetical protein ACFPRL_13405 [Pseudoclavibacter helvolus]